MGEESQASLRERGMSFIRDITAQYPGKKVLVISHGIFLGQTLKALLRDETTGDNLHNTSVTTVAHDGDRWEYVLYACTRHLRALDSEEHPPQ
ncbi:histidine phosphatase family protein [Paenibacillus hemerocallicola]|uniref:Histidine phosphatase family protein n=1 Tax=Paenibacillus hemerocallicola TaxID=1172614 RepID=A0A5C4T5V3_9BACL|nr:histidine phosphatase family protein [Paenibacillus hemerocallicola]TNJ64443.1 histidine phosphatase family protein [Paenibacillus hemerocallicola]